MTLQEVLERTTWRFGSKTFLFCDDKEITYESAVERTRKMAGALEKLGVGKGDRVAIFSINSMNYVLGMFGIWNLGAIITTVDFRYADSMDYFVTDSDSKVLLFSQNLAGLVEKNRSKNKCVEHYVCFDGPGEGVEGALNWEEIVDAADPVRKDVAETDPCHLSYTSGSTGAPKGAVLAHEPTAQATSCIAERLRLTEDIVTLGPTTLSSSQHLVANLLPGTTRGCTIGLMPDWDQTEAWRIIHQRGVNALFANPLLLKDLYNEWREKKLDKGTLKFTASGGAPVPPELKRGFQDEMKVPLVESYGMSELGGFVALGDPEPYDDEHFAAIGRTLPDKEVIIADENDRELPIGEVGEILLRRGFMWGYWRREEDTARTLRNGWLHTSDLGRMDKKGYLYLMARKGDEIRWGDKMIFPRDMEEALLQNPAVRYPAVIGVADDKLGQKPKAIVELYQGKSATEDDLRKTVEEHLGAENIPPICEILEEMPLTATGKINKAALKERELTLQG
jgi:acyl-CoA synthetase (AMP-forming)/AMP-acid ligase II